MTKLLERVVDMDIAPDRDVIAAALEGCAALKRPGHGAGLNALRRELGRRFEAQGLWRGATEAGAPA